MRVLITLGLALVSLNVAHAQQQQFRDITITAEEYPVLLQALMQKDSVMSVLINKQEKAQVEARTRLQKEQSDAAAQAAAKSPQGN